MFDYIELLNQCLFYTVLEIASECSIESQLAPSISHTGNQLNLITFLL